MMYTFIIGTGFVENNSNSCAILNLNVSPDQDEGPKNAIELFISMLYHSFQTDAVILAFIENLIYKNLNGLKHYLKILDNPGFRLWGEILPGFLIYIKGFDRLFDEEPYKCFIDVYKIEGDILPQEEIRAETISVVKLRQDLFHVDPLPTPQKIKCPYCQGKGIIV